MDEQEQERLYQEEMAAQKKRHDDWNKYQEKMRRDHAAQMALQEREAIAEKAKAEVVKLASETSDTVDIRGLKFVNGKVVDNTPPPPSIAVIKTRQLSESFAAIRNKK